jgi:hypothetical protein
MECALSAPTWCRRAEDDGALMWRDADIEARDFKSNALIARDVRDQIN